MSTSTVSSSSSDQSVGLVRHVRIDSFRNMGNVDRHWCRARRWLAGGLCWSSSSAHRCDFHSCLLYVDCEFSRTVLAQTTGGYCHSYSLEHDGPDSLYSFHAGVDVSVSNTRGRYVCSVSARQKTNVFSS